MNKIRLNPTERRVTILLSALFSCRMLGLFLLLPVFIVSVYELPGSEIPWLVGLTIGIYGLVQAIMQIPLGLASDYFGRKRIVLLGLTLFILGGIICIFSKNLFCLLVGRAIQGMGAISSAITAWLSDNTRQEVRARAMAIVGSSIGISFALSIVLSPLLVGKWKLPGLFVVTVLLGIFGVIIAAFFIPLDSMNHAKCTINQRIVDVFLNKDLMKMNFGVFVLHFLLTALFLIIPKCLLIMGQMETKDLWKAYLPIVLASFFFVIPLILFTERYRKYTFMLRIMVISLIIIHILLFWAINHSFPAMIFVLISFFTVFNFLEALQPSLISRLSPEKFKGLALGVYNTSQSIGLFLGGFIGGLLMNSEKPFRFLTEQIEFSMREVLFFHAKISLNGITANFCIIIVLSILWLALTWNLKVISRSYN